MLDRIDRIVLSQSSYGCFAGAAIPVTHPTIDEVVNRQREISVWLSRVTDARNRRLWYTVSALAVAPAVFMWVWMIVPVVVFCGLAAKWHRRLGWVDEPPPPINIIPFGDSQNDLLLLTERPRRFQATCDCPGCGDWQTHSLDILGNCLVRECGLCRRKWLEEK